MATNPRKKLDAKPTPPEKEGGKQAQVEKKPTTTAPAASPLAQLKLTTDVMLMLYPKDKRGNFKQSIDTEDETTVYNLIRGKTDFKEKLLILLDTSGGNVYTAVKIMDTLRTKYKEIIIAVPQEAKSSGTMMCCGANKIIMTSISELGPLDKPMVHPNDETAVISALDIVKSIDGMIEKGLDEQKAYAIQLSKEMGLPIRKALEVAGDSVSKLISPMLCREDVKIYNQAKRLLAIAETYGSELLNNYMLSYIGKDALRKRISEMVLRQLIWLYPDHAFAIRRSELKEWFFIVDDAEEQPFWDELWKEFVSHIDSNTKAIKFL
jgi:ATP-dependent protease ClpP protease subunit